MMTKQQHITYWISSSEHDLLAMDSLFTSGHYAWSLFIGHLVIEKILKARWLLDHDEPVPPKTHSLDKLAKETGLQLDESTMTWLVQANDFNLETRYPDYRMEFYKKATREFAETNISRIKDIFQCVRKTMP